jgi:hypothetical protein
VPARSCSYTPSTPEIPTRSPACSRRTRVLELLLGDLTEVAQDVGADRAERVVANRELEDVHTREILRVLLHVQRDVLGHADDERHRGEDVIALQRIVQTALPAPRPGCPGARTAHQDALGVVAELLAVDREHEPKLVVHQLGPVDVADHPARRGHLDQTDRVVVGLAAELLGRQDLEEPQSGGERGEHHHDERGQDLRGAGRHVDRSSAAHHPATRREREPSAARRSSG